MGLSILVLAAGLLSILAGAKVFTNGVEWLGKRLNLSEGAVGSVLAAVGTALPETMVPLDRYICIPNPVVPRCCHRSYFAPRYLSTWLIE